MPTKPDGERKAVFLLHQEGVAKRAIARQLRLSRNAVRQIIAQSGQRPLPLRPPRLVVDPDLLRQLHQECAGYAQRMREKLQEEHGITVKYSTLTRHLRDLGITGPSLERCQRVPDEPGAEMQHDTSRFVLPVGASGCAFTPACFTCATPNAATCSFTPSSIAFA